MPTKKQLEEQIEILKACDNAKKLTIQKLQQQNRVLQQQNRVDSEAAAFSRSWEHQFLEEQEKNNKLEKQIEKLKKHYQSDLYEWKGKHQSLQDMLDLYIEASRN